MSESKKNIMKEICIDKITLNIGTGKPGPDLEKAIKLLEILTESKPIETKTNKRNPTWNLRPGLSIGCKVTLRGKKAEEMLDRLFQAIDKTISPKKFDKNGNFSFGIAEYIDIPGTKYNMDIGIIGLEVAVTLKRPGYRIKDRRMRRRKLPARHRISKKDAMDFVHEKYNVNVEEVEER